MFSEIKNDIRVVKDRDPAAKNSLEIILCYSGLHAIWFYRLAHYFYTRNCFVTARCISTLGRFFTGIEIHPGAKIGHGLFIDHGMGIVIGETTVIGDNVTLYQGVTLGGTGKEKGKRHPTIGDYAVIACGAKVLGSFTVGENAKIGAGSVVLHPVPADSTVIGIPGHVVRSGLGHLHVHSEKNIDLNHDKMPDPIEEQIKTLQKQILMLRHQVNSMKEAEHEHYIEYYI